jgi:hypothetical protein
MPLARRHIAVALALPGLAQASEQATLVIAGAIAPPSPRLLTLSEIDALGAATLETRTPWTRGTQRFGGVPLAVLLDSVGSRGNVIRAQALNDYAISSPIDELLESEAFLATRLDGEPIPIRHRGPFWMVFPWSARPAIRTAATNRRAVWQLKRLDIA